MKIVARAFSFICNGCGASRGGSPSPSGLCQVCLTGRTPGRP